MEKNPQEQGNAKRFVADLNTLHFAGDGPSKTSWHKAPRQADECSMITVLISHCDQCTYLRLW